MRNVNETSQNLEADARYTLVVQRGLLEEFRLVAKRHDRTVQAQLRQVMREAIEREQEAA